MRCLHCNKKLSLLKLAKGDSFCSPEHFDAYQFQQSKNAIERLMSLGDPEPPKAPLQVKPVEEAKPAAPPPPPQAPPARTPVQSPNRNAAPEPAAPEVAAEPPPYAPFAAQERPYCPPQFQIADGPDSKLPVDSPAELALPTHIVPEASGILNLHLELSASSLSPVSWNSTREAIVAAERFEGTVTHPSLVVEPGFPEIGVEVEETPAAQPDLASEADSAPWVEIPPIAEPPKPAQKERREVKQVYLTAPSFEPRRGGSTFVDRAASSQSGGFSISPVIGRDVVPRLTTVPIPALTFPFKAISLRLQDFPIQPTARLSEFSALPAPLLPAVIANVCGRAWRPSARLIDLSRNALDTSLPYPRPADFEPPRPAALLVRPDPPPLHAIELQQILAETGLDANSPLVHVLRTRPVEHKSTARQKAYGLKEFGLRPTLGPSPIVERFSDSPWQTSTNHWPLASSVANVQLSPVPPAEPFGYATLVAPQPPTVVGSARTPWSVGLICLPLASHEIEWTAETIQAEPVVVFSSSTRIPGIAGLPSCGFSIGQVGPAAEWEARPPSPLDERIARSLPVRDTVVLPAARSWPRLIPVPR